jgi:hypothetical protein
LCKTAGDSSQNEPVALATAKSSSQSLSSDGESLELRQIPMTCLRDHEFPSKSGDAWHLSIQYRFSAFFGGLSCPPIVSSTGRFRLDLLGIELAENHPDGLADRGRFRLIQGRRSRVA